MSKDKSIKTKTKSSFATNHSTTQWMFKQLGVAVATILFLCFIYNGSAIYQWVYTGLLKGNYEVIQKYPHTTYQQRLEMKLGEMVPFLNYIKENTPETAVILFPSVNDGCFEKIENGFDLKQLNNSSILCYGAIRFLWPRQCVRESQKGKTALYDRVTHVAIINGWGYQHLNYSVKEPHPLGVLPKTK